MKIQSSDFTKQLHQLLLCNAYTMSECLTELVNTLPTNFLHLIGLLKGQDSIMIGTLFWIVFFDEVKSLIKDIPNKFIKSLKKSITKAQKGLELQGSTSE